MFSPSGLSTVVLAGSVYGVLNLSLWQIKLHKVTVTRRKNLLLGGVSAVLYKAYGKESSFSQCTGCLYSLDWTTRLENHTQNTNIQRPHAFDHAYPSRARSE